MVIEAELVRWQMEEFHRSFKQLTGLERCQCRKAVAQRNHWTYCCLAWASLRQHACRVGQTIYQAHWRLFFFRMERPIFQISKVKARSGVNLTPSYANYAMLGVRFTASGAT